MVFSIQAKNDSQKLGLVQANGSTIAITDVAPVIVYTCPANKTAEIISFSGRTTSFGNGTLLDFSVASLTFRRLTSTSNDMNDIVAGGSPVLAAGETLGITTDSTSNALAIWAATLRERPV